MEENNMEKLDELKKLVKLYKIVKLEEPIDIKVRMFNFRTGCADTLVDMKVDYVGKVPYGSWRDETILSEQIVMVYGTKTYSSGNSYLGSHKLTYTDSEELQKVIDAVKDKEQFDYTAIGDELRKYVN